MVQAIDRLLEDYTEHEVAASLNRDGYRSGTGIPFTARMVMQLRPRSLIQHVVRLYLLSEAQDGHLPMHLVAKQESWRLGASDWKPLRDPASQGRAGDCT